MVYSFALLLSYIFCFVPMDHDSKHLPKPQWVETLNPTRHVIDMSGFVFPCSLAETL